jgi:hypothetical protein
MRTTETAHATAAPTKTGLRMRALRARHQAGERYQRARRAVNLPMPRLPPQTDVQSTDSLGQREHSDSTAPSSTVLSLRRCVAP